ncbi:universal stress protein [Haloterrigena sp. SYSU A121-1]|uniref:Universal stress protein n=1 Tax=Haloterrigena gelatinilytica TaxID=2741724 RepID=A0A8J8GQW8_9EURY|nr:universal stress protein [Haloterrigena gelatinilytica]NUB93540.1 universal stress protein [Haloterrigena gelatinilytica]
MNRILVPIDGSSESLAALDYALTTFPEAELVALYVLSFVEVTASETSAEEARDRADEILESATDLAAEYDRSIETDTAEGDPGRSILAYADDTGIDHIVMGSTGRTGFQRLLLGSVTELVTRRATVPVTIVR